MVSEYSAPKLYRAAWQMQVLQKPISARYFIVELLTALAFLILVRQFGIGYKALIYIILVCCLIIATFVDISHRIIPDEISLGGIAAGFILNAAGGFIKTAGAYDIAPAVNSFLGIIIGGGIILLYGGLYLTWCISGC